jgi:transcriptional regulator with XRE-family HTH domain
MDAMLTPEKLRAIRAIRGMTQSQLAIATGVSPTAISEFEAGKRDMRASTIVKLCEALGVTVVYRVGDTEITGP